MVGQESLTNLQTRVSLTWSSAHRNPLVTVNTQPNPANYQPEWKLPDRANPVNQPPHTAKVKQEDPRPVSQQNSPVDLPSWDCSEWVSPAKPTPVTLSPVKSGSALCHRTGKSDRPRPTRAHPDRPPTD